MSVAPLGLLYDPSRTVLGIRTLSERQSTTRLASGHLSISLSQGQGEVRSCLTWGSPLKLDRVLVVSGQIPLRRQSTVLRNATQPQPQVWLDRIKLCCGRMIFAVWARTRIDRRRTRVTYGTDQSSSSCFTNITIHDTVERTDGLKFRFLQYNPTLALTGDSSLKSEHDHRAGFDNPTTSTAQRHAQPIPVLSLTCKTVVVGVEERTPVAPNAFTLPESCLSSRTSSG